MIEKSKSSRGQTMVEFAFIMVLLFLFIMGILEWSIILYDKAILTDACREGAREGILYRADPASDFDDAPLIAGQIRNAINNHLHDRLVTYGTPFNPASDVIIGWDWDPPVHEGDPIDEWETNPIIHGGRLGVQVNFRYRYLALRAFAGVLGGGMGDGTLTLSARSIMRME